MHVDGKQPRPWRHGQDGGRERRPGHRGYGHDGGVEPNPLAQAALGVDELDHRRVHAHHHRCPDSLHHAGNDKHGERRRERAQQRTEREHHYAAHVNLLVTPQLAHRGKRKQEHHHRQLEGVDYPDGVFRSHPELRGHARQGHVAYRTVEHGKEKAAERGRHGVVDAWAVQTVPFEVALYAQPALAVRPCFCVFFVHNLTFLYLQS